MATISEQERKRIQRYCIYPKIAGAALAMAFVLPFLIIPFEMIDISSSITKASKRRA